MSSLLTIKAGPDAQRVLRARGLRLDDIDVFPGASGGAKWLVLGGIDRYLFGEFLQGPRRRPLHLIGSSIGSWRMASLAQRDPVAALARGHHGYVYGQRYSRRPSPAEVSSMLAQILDDLLGPTGVDEILAHPTFRAHVITAEGRGLAASDRRLALATSLGLAAAANLVTRRTLALHFRRCVFHSAGDTTPFAHLTDLPTRHEPLTRDNLRAALLASGSIPLLMDGVRIPGVRGTYWDGGVLDYHLDMDLGDGPGLVLYPHFYDFIVPGWFDKSLPWRRASSANFTHTVLVAPSQSFVRSLPGGKIPDRRDFYDLTPERRMERWQAVLDASAALGDVLRELVTSGRIADVARPF
jgi:Patatin-like phospholipase